MLYLLLTLMEKKMSKKNIFRLLIAFVGVNLFLLLTGVVIPFLISTDDLPITAIVFLITTIIAAIISVALILSHKKLNK